jgi:hypothetical protein
MPLGVLKKIEFSTGDLIMAKIIFIWGSGDAPENGLWEDDQMLATSRHLERDTALPLSANDGLSIEDFLG